jgi:hypothetical protein
LSESPTLENLRAAFAQPDDAPDPASCPADGEIWDAVHGALAPGRLREIVDHLAVCTACAESWRVALQFERGDAAADRQADRPPAAQRVAAAVRRPRRWLYAGTAAAAAVVLAGLLVTHDLGDRGDRGDLRKGAGTAGSTLRGGGTAIDPLAPRWLTEAGAVLSRRHAELRWSGPPGTLYDLEVDREVRDERVAVAAERGTYATIYTLPQAVVSALPAGTGLYAVLTAHLPDGTPKTLFRDLHIE